MDTIRTVITILLIIVAGAMVFTRLLPFATDPYTFERVQRAKNELRRKWSMWTRYTTELGGYVHDTAMAQYIPPNAMHCVTGTWTDIAGQVVGTICRHKAAAAETATINVPIMIPSNSVALKGCMLKYVELDYEIQVAALTSMTLSIVKVTRGADGAVAVVSAPAGTQLLLPATTAATLNKHRDRFTLTTPIYIADGEYYFLKAVAVAPATTTLDLLSAVAYFTERM